MKVHCLLLALLAGLSGSARLVAQSETERGAVGGAVAGAVIGGIIGHQNDETAEGILIGGAAGGLLGGLMGQNRDQQVYRYQEYQRQQAVRYYRGVSLQDVVTMSHNGVSPQVIINQINMNGVQQRPGVQEIISLHQQGVPEPVIDAMQRAPLATATAAPARTIVVEPGCYHTPPPVIIYRRPPVHYGWGHFHDHW